MANPVIKVPKAFSRHSLCFSLHPLCSPPSAPKPFYRAFREIPWVMPLKPCLDGSQAPSATAAFGRSGAGAGILSSWPLILYSPRTTNWHSFKVHSAIPPSFPPHHLFTSQHCLLFTENVGTWLRVAIPRSYSSS